MSTTRSLSLMVTLAGLVCSTSPAWAQIGSRFPVEKRVVPDPVTGAPLTFLTSVAGDSKIYPTHAQWTADGQWLVFRSGRVRGELMAVNEESGVQVQVTERGYFGTPCLAQRSMTLYLLREKAPATQAPRDKPRSVEVVAVDLARLFADSEKATLQPAAAYEKVHGATPAQYLPAGDLALDANEDAVYFRVSGGDTGSRLPPGTKPAAPFGPRNMGGGASGLYSLQLATGEVKLVVEVPFQVGHVQSNPWVPGEIVFCWETGGKAPQRTWVVRADGSGLRPLYPEAPYEWITHEAVVTKDEAALAIIAHREVGLPESDPWGPAGSGDHPSGLAIVNLRTREMRIVGQLPMGDAGKSVWHVHASPDGRWAVADDFQYRLWLIDRRSGEMALLADLGHATTAADHLHPTFSADSKRIHVQSAMLSANGRAMGMCVVPVPASWLARKYDSKLE